MKIVYQGSPGAYSHLAAKKIYPDYEAISQNTFEECFNLCLKNESYRTIIPVENSIAGRVADIQYLINKYKLQIYAEHFQPITHNLMILPSSSMKNISSVRSHTQAISQCQKIIIENKLEPIIAADTAGSAKYISDNKIKNEAAIASELAAEIYNLKIVKKNIEEGKGFRLFDGKSSGTTYDFASSNPLWQATLDTLDFMPLVSANYSGGIVITDWYSENNTPNESVKISVRFLTNEIRSDALDIDVFLKKCSENLTNCSISKNNNDLVADLNLNILKKASKYQREILEKRKKENPIPWDEARYNLLKFCIWTIHHLMHNFLHGPYGFFQMDMETFPNNKILLYLYLYLT